MEVPQGHEAAALRTAAQNKPPANARPWPRGSGGASAAAAPPPPPPKVYRVEPREFRDLVQRLTGAPPTALRRPQHQHQHHRAGVAAPPPVQPQPVRPGGGGGEQPVYGAPAPWFSFPMAGAVEAAAAQPQHGAFL
ncbi:hypothetical protein SORBI_3008G188000 [Sorghum bicolor]|nr:hypothetical protein SORBI_3008G188000 [Sorghum bicolor]OQU79729.1 hypothetical protein SORBI_3008G188000 [Sorghum bicolor]